MLGIFDSGLGGLTVVRQIERVFPRAGYIYLGDTARLPYGTKSFKTVERYAVDALKLLKKKGATTAVVACHTVSSVLAVNPAARRRCAALFPKSELFDVVAPALAGAKKATRNRRIGVLGTATTIRSGVYQRALRGYTVVPVPASVLVALAEEGWAFRRGSGQGRYLIEPILRNILKPFQQKRVDTLILACTHFPLLERRIRDILGKKVVIIDPGAAVARALRENAVAVRPGHRRFLATDVSADFSERASRFLGRSVRAELVDL